MSEIHEDLEDIVNQAAHKLAITTHLEGLLGLPEGSLVFELEGPLDTIEGDPLSHMHRAIHEVEDALTAFMTMEEAIEHYKKGEQQVHVRGPNVNDAMLELLPPELRHIIKDAMEEVSREIKRSEEEGK